MLFHARDVKHGRGEREGRKARSDGFQRTRWWERRKKRGERRLPEEASGCSGTPNGGKKRSVTTCAREVYYLAGGHFGSTVPPLFVTFFPVVFPEAEELGSRELDIGSKKIFIDLRMNDQGKFVRIVEVSSHPSLPPSLFPVPSSFQSCDRTAFCVMLS